MMGSPRGINEADVLGDATSHADYAPVYLAWGVVGWEGDNTTDDAVTLGDGSSNEDARTMVKVTLFRGRDPSKRPQKGVATGRKIWAQIGGPLWAVPPIGTQVVVGIPDGDEESPGNAVVLFWAMASPTQQFKGSRAVLDVGANVDLVLKGRSVTMMDHGKDESPSRFACWLTVGPVAGGQPSISAMDQTGSGWTVGNGVVGLFATDKGSPSTVKAFVQVKQDALGLGINGSGLIKVDGSGNVTIGCPGALALPAAQVLIGAAATAATGVGYGPPNPATPATLYASTSVFVSP